MKKYMDSVEVAITQLPGWAQDKIADANGGYVSLTGTIRAVETSDGCAELHCVTGQMFTLNMLR